MGNSRFFKKTIPERINSFLPGSWLKEIYAPCTADFPRAIRKEKEENAR